MKSRPKPGNPIKNPPTNQLRALLDKAEQHRSLESAIHALLPEKLASKCRLGGIRNGELTLLVHSSALASQVRFQQRTLLPQLRKDDRLAGIWRIRVRVSPAPHQPEPYRPLRSLSTENARLLEEEAGHTEDEALKEVLLKLAKHQQ